ncbi:MAG: type 1 glutamine amidotransferase [Cypionkella sp.]
MRVAIVENTKVTHHGQVGVALHEVAALVEIYRPWKDAVLPEAGSFDALISFGGEQSALDDRIHPYLPRLASLMAEEAASGTAVLGVCLGAQLMARGLGAANQLGTAPEFGWCEVSRLGEAADDPALGALPARFDIFEWHSDTFSLPPGAAHLAGSPVAAVQCFRYGRAGYGMQFHFEASCAVARDWARLFPELSEQMFPGWLAALPEREKTQGLAADAHGLAIARAWVALI